MVAKRILSTLGAVLAVGGGSLLTASQAQAVPVYDCYWKTNTGITLFRSATSTTGDYFVGANVKMIDFGCNGQTTGRSYSDCGGDNRWVDIDSVANAPAKHGFAAYGCITYTGRVLHTT
ncbi:hypothetical protein F1D05_17910 [Kribbella qitaiheensis]|uniref:Secreted protein n=1 Tax=Kribbella qitaiheensis TaxID=1544730 RepID=A0A7G6WZM9_9ACTN|nr:hypothetical protein [Kribbella qitaiheensis]QNE19444.1 hypothetical protein F1D05_17910 [Kribbella qitaiheensis]